MDLHSGPGLTRLLTIPGVGETRAVKLAGACGDWATLTSATHADLTAAVGKATADKVLTWLADPAPAPALSGGVRVVSRWDPDYPPLLRLIPDPPTLLWVRGTLPPGEVPAVAIVGTRNPTLFGERAAAAAGKLLAESGCSHISGLAVGLDNIGANAAIVAGGRSWAYIGQGLDTFPATGPRAETARQILAHGGGVIAEVPPDTPGGAPWLLTKRNRLQSGTGAVTFIAQSGVPTPAGTAGTMHTARFALQQRRLLAATRPAGQWAEEPESAGCLALTDPNGCDPAVVYADREDSVALVAGRAPVADLVIHTAADLPAIVERARGLTPTLLAQSAALPRDQDPSALPQTDALFS